MNIENGVYKSALEYGQEDRLCNTLGELVDLIVEEHKDNKAFSCVLPTGHVADMTYAELGRASDALACYLRQDLGLERGDTVALMSPNIMSYPIVAFGVFKAGLKLTNINPLYTSEEANHQLKDSQAKVMFVIDVFGDRLAKATEGSNVSEVVSLSLTDMYSWVPRTLLNFALKYLKKIIPTPTVSFCDSFMGALVKGQKHMNAGKCVKDFRDGQTADETAVFQYTGGTTGKSKGAELTHDNLVSNISQANKKNLDVLKDEDHTLMLVLPLYHVYAFAVGFVSSLKTGTHIVLVPVPRPMSNIKKVFDKFDISVFPSVNTLYLGLLHEPWFRENPPKSLKYCFSGAAPLQPAVAQEWKEFTGCDIYEGYGLTEGTCIVSSMDFKAAPVKGSVGQLIPGTSARIVDNGKDMPIGEKGELWLAGPQIMKGYLNRPEVNAESFEGEWLKTGDVAQFDEEGNLYIVDRIKDLVIVSGFNVFPTDLEACMTQFEMIDDAAVVGVPDDETGERLIAYVIPKGEGVTAEAIIEECRKHLTGYKVPKTIRFVDEMPKSPVGKVLRRELRDKAIAEECK
ncbi:AMP-binding protein [Temperatibacter marinus]|uniref:AMP-binding protein n=1 Tax=Temperatibacter marinus TaxID=1456591 RepID=A0AA52EG83_9PROT|nr:AMP-binding protein [Temperatibacter marinus]WND01954.1 AMP-binding protein [Temperatibacter marinus]